MQGYDVSVWSPGSREEELHISAHWCASAGDPCTICMINPNLGPCELSAKKSPGLHEEALSLSLPGKRLSGIQAEKDLPLCRCRLLKMTQWIGDCPKGHLGKHVLKTAGPQKGKSQGQPDSPKAESRSPRTLGWNRNRPALQNIRETVDPISSTYFFWVLTLKIQVSQLVPLGRPFSPLPIC